MIIINFIIDVLKKLVGSSEYGKVYCVYKRNRKLMALKIINIKKFNIDEDGNQEISKKLESKLRTAVSIGTGSSFLLQISEYLIENNYCYLLMEYGNIQKTFNDNKKEKKAKISKIVLLLLLMLFVCIIFFF
jgi:serine/threonine protein kinase